MVEGRATNSGPVSAGNEDSSGGYDPHRMVSILSYKNKSPIRSVIIKEKVLPDPTIVRTSSRRARRHCRVVKAMWQQ
uniref:Uncharacterized protein n=1 Tax=Parascaris univalens TaxID=6257 RepID=A0A915A281_PARUN